MLILLPLFVLTMILITYSNYAVSVIKNEAYNVNYKALKTYMGNVEESLRAMEIYWIGLKFSSEILTFATSESEMDRQIMIYRLKTDMESAVQSYQFIDSLFIYSQEQDEYIEASKYILSIEERKEIKSLVLERADLYNIYSESAQRWYPVQINDNYYLIRIFKVQNAYIGGCISVSSLLSSMSNSGFSDVEYMALTDGQGTELGETLPAFNTPLAIETTTLGETVKSNTHSYIAIGVWSEFADFATVMLINEASILEGLHSFRKILVLWVLSILVFLVLFIVVLNKTIRRPIRVLYDTMNRLKQGDLDVCIGTTKRTCLEFELLNRTFDEMIASIKNLKIDVYEQKTKLQKAEIRQKNIELQYWKEQIQPHFYINCLNVINSLAQLRKNDQILGMTKYLSNQLRYAMSPMIVDTLGRELDMIENYLQIQRLCHGDNIRLHTEVYPSACKVMVPPMVLLTFVENVCKHQAATDEMIDIYIVCELFVKNTSPFLRIEIWDTGEGYPEHVLTSLEEGRRIIDGRGEHFGIRNVIARMHLIYDGAETICVKNHWETGGAYVVMELPIIGTDAPPDPSSDF